MVAQGLRLRTWPRPSPMIDRNSILVQGLETSLLEICLLIWTLNVWQKVRADLTKGISQENSSTRKKWENSKVYITSLLHLCIPLIFWLCWFQAFLPLHMCRLLPKTILPSSISSLCICLLRTCWSFSLLTWQKHYSSWFCRGGFILNAALLTFLIKHESLPFYHQSAWCLHLF